MNKLNNERKLERRKLSEKEAFLGFSGCAAQDLETGCIGHLRIDFGRDNEFWSTWWGRPTSEKSEAFGPTLDHVINTLRLDCLSDRRKCMTYCYNNLEDIYKERGYGMRVDSGTFSFILRICPQRGDYDVYCYCYDKEKMNSYLDRQ